MFVKITRADIKLPGKLYKVMRQDASAPDPTEDTEDINIKDHLNDEYILKFYRYRHQLFSKYD